MSSSSGGQKGGYVPGKSRPSTTVRGIGASNPGKQNAGSKSGDSGNTNQNKKSKDKDKKNKATNGSKNGAQPPGSKLKAQDPPKDGKPPRKVNKTDSSNDKGGEPPVEQGKVAKIKEQLEGRDNPAYIQETSVDKPSDDHNGDQAITNKTDSPTGDPDSKDDLGASSVSPLIDLDEKLNPDGESLLDKSDKGASNNDTQSNRNIRIDSPESSTDIDDKTPLIKTTQPDQDSHISTDSKDNMSLGSLGSLKIHSRDIDTRSVTARSVSSKLALADPITDRPESGKLLIDNPNQEDDASIQSASPAVRKSTSRASPFASRVSSAVSRSALSNDNILEPRISDIPKAGTPQPVVEPKPVEETGTIDKPLNLSGMMESKPAEETPNTDKPLNLSSLMESKPAEETGNINKPHNLSGIMESKSVEEKGNIDKPHNLSGIMESKSVEEKGNIDKPLNLSGIMKNRLDQKTSDVSNDTAQSKNKELIGTIPPDSSNKSTPIRTNDFEMTSGVANIKSPPDSAKSGSSHTETTSLSIDAKSLPRSRPSTASSGSVNKWATSSSKPSPKPESVKTIDDTPKMTKSASAAGMAATKTPRPGGAKSAPPGRAADSQSSKSQLKTSQPPKVDTNAKQLKSASTARQNQPVQEDPFWGAGIETKLNGETGNTEEKQPEVISPRILHLAQRNEWQVLDQILRAMDKANPDKGVNLQDEDTGMSPLMYAIRENRLVVTERLIEMGAKVNEKTTDGRTPIHFAAAHSKEDMVKLLLNRKAEANCIGGPKDQLPLHMASSRPSGVLTIVQQLIRSAGNTRLIMDKDGATPLFLAAESGNATVCRELLQHAGEQQVTMHKQDTKDTVLHIACRRKDFDMARLFVDNHAVVDAQNVDGHTPLHICAWEGDDAMVKFLHAHKANANMIDNLDRTPLHIAAERGHTAIVELLVDKLKANVSARTKDGSTLMHISSQYGHPDTALAFLKKGVPLNMPNKSGALCLHAAAMKGHVNVIKALLQKGAAVDSKTKDGYTALHIAVEHCKPLAVQTLLGFGAQVELKGGKAKETPLHIASRVPDGEKCAEMLIKSGADVNAAQENGETALHIASRFGILKMVQALLEEGAKPTWQSKNGENPLHVAARYCHWEVADELLTFVTKFRSRLDASMLVNHQNTEGETPVHYAAELTKTQAHNEFEDTDMIKLLMTYDGDINIATKLTNETALHYCARAGNADVILEMVKYIGPSRTQQAVNKQAKNGWSPLLVASEHGHLEIVKILLKHNARVDVFDEHGKAALHLAAENGNEGVADVLLWHRAFVNAKSKLGVTPLHLAAQNGYNKLVKLLIETHGAAIDALTLKKQTPLHMAAQTGKIEECNLLLKMKADANATDVHGQTPLHLAAENDHSDVVKLFLKHRPELVTMANTNGMTCAHIAASKGSVAVVKELMRFNKTVVTTARNRTNESTTLHLATAGGHGDVVQVLLEAGASATDENADGMTAIHLAARHGHINVLYALKDKVSWNVTSTKTGFTALHVAAHYGQMDFVREMLTKVPATVRSEPPHSGDSTARDMGPEYGYTPLHLAAQSGHEGLVRLLLNCPGVQADAATSVHGSIPLHLAAQSGYAAVVSLLLSKSTNQLHVKDKRGRTGLHLAASNGHLDMVALLLGQGADIDVYDKSGWTPLHFAAKAGHLPVVKLLIESGANPKYETKDGKVPIYYAAAHNHADVLSYLMAKDHDTHLLMEDKKFCFDLMVVGKQNDNQSIEEFILMSKAPVETAVKLSKQFRLLATKEKERAKDLYTTGDYCETMATELNALASSANSAGMILKAVDSRGNPFLDVLIECEQKEVVSHPLVQKYLSEVWMGHLSHWSGWKMILLFVLMMIIPPIWLALSLPFKHRFNKVPVIKFMSYLVSHIYLIVLFIVTVVTPLVPISWSGDLIPHWYEWLLLSWLSGLIVSQLTNPEDRAGLGWIKVIIIAVCVMGVCAHIIGFAFPFSVNPVDSQAGYNNSRLECLYVRNQFFGFALMLCFVQMMDFLSFHHLFGPWAIIIRDLMKDLIRFLVILSIFMVGFTLHLTAVYQPVYDAIPLDPNKGNGTGSGGASTETPLETFELLFFALFGLVEPENLPPVHRNPVWSLSLVKAVFGTYLLVSLIVLINLLIAMMSDTYQRIQAQSDTEWKFGRAKLFRNMNKTSATPSPLNLVTKLFVYCKVLFKHKGKVCNMNAQYYVDEEEDLETHADAQSMEGANSQGANSTWLRGMVRRNTQVSPDGDFLHSNNANRGPMRIEDVVEWTKVVDKYLNLRGRGDGEVDNSFLDRIDDMEGEKPSGGVEGDNPV